MKILWPVCGRRLKILKLFVKTGIFFFSPECYTIRKVLFKAGRWILRRIFCRTDMLSAQRLAPRLMDISTVAEGGKLYELSPCKG